ncbi:3-demethylubiquinone-9 3-methyltransferase [Breoghania corrubedonensis]|uniref:Ubiquinone biosynthesis O-methyltransferase n=1 Tax=Breoghania corrubedonensis TaxID=665038 RepID=A0A2T5V5X6_9HYPH|nr:bifunctional 2-polyprenyl-6-hydroxyphenol methylase/3-demethylubiquinol 3-O-methyltransferase UbiG [Breoghania corrubedonensis]PTW59158.1 3-demethylubiquinone-9 3-methyltransferase [Breoghania corrubedonensis]
MTTKTTVDDAEVARFSAMADEWWDPTGKFRPLHKFSPVRLGYIKEHVSAHFARNAEDPAAFKGLRFLDIGCGGGLLCEPMTRLGAEVIGVDPSPVNIEVARLHAERSGLQIDYRATTAEDLAAAGERFDVVLNMEVVEHVADVPVYLAACAQLVKPGGLMFVATINRTLKAYALAIVAAERVLRWLPPGTHSYEKLVKPAEIEGPLGEAGMTIVERCGVTYNPLLDRWNRSRDMDMNYMLLAARPK